MVSSCYIHIPFCKEICAYCDFPKLLYNEKFIDKYLDSLEKEIVSKYKGETLKTIYIGGGTPSSLTLNQLERLLKILRILNTSKDIEYTIEGNFSSTTKEKLMLYKKYGINRLSLGIESIDSDNLSFLGRNLDIEEVKNKIKEMRILGFNNINLDLMYAIPNETIEVLKNDLDFILSLDVEHISTYSLIIEKNTLLGLNNIKNIDQDLDYKMYDYIVNRLKDHGYDHYEISNFAKKGYESNHNKCYWLNNEYYGFGLGASSYYNQKRTTNTKSISKYNNGNYEYEVEELKKDDIIEYEIILGLRMIDGINLRRFKSKYNEELTDLYDCSSLINDKLLIINNGYLSIPEDKLYISNEIMVKLLQNKK